MEPGRQNRLIRESGIGSGVGKEFSSSWYRETPGLARRSEKKDALDNRKRPAIQHMVSAFTGGSPKIGSDNGKKSFIQRGVITPFRTSERNGRRQSPHTLNLPGVSGNRKSGLFKVHRHRLRRAAQPIEPAWSHPPV